MHPDNVLEQATKLMDAVPEGKATPEDYERLRKVLEQWDPYFFREEYPDD